MKISVIKKMICSNCHVALKHTSLAGTADNIEYGFLACPRCATGLTVLAGFIIAEHLQLAEELPTLKSLLELEQQLLPRSTHYGEDLRSLGRRSYDAYAAFQPFNESTRALFPLLEHLRRHFLPGDLILDTWCRTGFSGALLAGLFPDQHIVSLWEGNLGVLGYEGYAYWLGSHNRLPNWDIIFTHPGHGIPFMDASFALVHGLDSLHRYPFQPFLSDCLRMVKRHGAIVFPHVHLTNSEPVPFFERGGVQLHGKYYQNYFEKALVGTTHRAFVLSEKNLFELDEPMPLADQASSAHYNGLIAILDKAHTSLLLKPWESGLLSHERPIRLSLASIDPTSGNVHVDSDRSLEMLARHPCFAQRLARVVPAKLSPSQIKIWAWIEAGATWAEIGIRLGLSDDELYHEALILSQAELLMTLPIGAQMSQLQAFYTDREFLPALETHCFESAWTFLSKRYSERDILRTEDGSIFGASDVQDIVNAMSRLFVSLGLQRGQHMVLQADGHAEAILAIWACWLCGAVVVPLDPLMPPAERNGLIDRLAPGLLILDEISSEGLPSLCCSSPDASWPDFMLSDRLCDWIDEKQFDTYFSTTHLGSTENATAAILFTSGSTGKPKGVMLSHGTLFRGSHALSEAYSLGPTDVLCCPGGLHTMSGLRNTCLLPLLTGITLATPNHRHFNHPVSAAAACRRHGITVLSVVPAFVRLLRAATTPLAFDPLRQILCTGDTLPLPVQFEVEQLLGLPIYVYYGLTETGGVCTLLKPGMTRLADGDIGTPARAHLRLIGKEGELVQAAGVSGELEVYSAQLMEGYFDDPVASSTRFRGGWLRTGDLAHLKKGHFILLGRTDDMFKTKQGLAIHPGVIESLFCSHDDVAEAAVIAIKSSTGPRLHAWLITKHSMPKEWIDELQTWLSSRLNPQFFPEQIHLVDYLPRAANGKIAREVLRTSPVDLI